MKRNNMKKLSRACALTLGLAATSAGAQIGLGASVGAAHTDGETDLSYKAHVGWYGRVLGVEGQYIKFKDLGGDDRPNAETWAPALMLGLPLGSSVIYGKAGYSFAEVEGSSLEEEFSDDEVFYGVGLRLPATGIVDLRVEYERFEIGAADVDLGSIGLSVHF